MISTINIARHAASARCLQSVLGAVTAVKPALAREKSARKAHLRPLHDTDAT